jgi:tRNA-dihydrouridine synthase
VSTFALAIIICRGSLVTPWLFELVLCMRYCAPARDEVLEEWSWVVDRAEEHLGPERAVRYLRKFHPWYIERLGEAPPVQDALQRAGTLGEQRTLIAGLRSAVAA